MAWGLRRPCGPARLMQPLAAFPVVGAASSPLRRSRAGALPDLASCTTSEIGKLRADMAGDAALRYASRGAGSAPACGERRRRVSSWYREDRHHGEDRCDCGHITYMPISLEKAGMLS